MQIVAAASTKQGVSRVFGTFLCRSSRLGSEIMLSGHFTSGVSYQPTQKASKHLSAIVRTWSAKDRL